MHLKIPFRYQEIEKTENSSLSYDPLWCDSILEKTKYFSVFRKMFANYSKFSNNFRHATLRSKINAPVAKAKSNKIE